MESIRIVVAGAAELGEVQAILRRAPPWVLELVALAIEGSQEGLELCAVDQKLCPATGAHELRTVLEPAERLSRLVGALRAFDRERSSVVKSEFHSNHLGV